MLVLYWTVIALMGICGALAAVVARRDRAHRLLAAVLIGSFLADLARFALVTWVLPSPPPAAPIEGPLRLAIYADRALFLVWRAGVAAVALKHLARRPAWPVLPAWALAVAVLAIWYPFFRYDNLRKAYLALDLIASFVAVGSLLTFTTRRPRERPTGAALAASIAVAGHFAALCFGPFTQGFWGAAWLLALSSNAVTFTAIAVLYGVLLWRRPTSKP